MLQSRAGCRQLGLDVPSVPGWMPVLTIDIMVGTGIAVDVSSLCRARLCGCNVCGSAGKSPACLLPAWRHSVRDALLLLEPCPVARDALCSHSRGCCVLLPPLLTRLSPDGALWLRLPALLLPTPRGPLSRASPGWKPAWKPPVQWAAGEPWLFSTGPRTRVRSQRAAEGRRPHMAAATGSLAANSGSSWIGAAAAPAEVRLCRW